MLVNGMEARQIGLNIKAWLGELKRASMEPDAPSFPLKGPCRLQVRTRTTRKGAAVSAEPYIFQGGERFRVSSFFAENRIEMDATLIKVTLVPADVKLAGTISSMTLTLVEATELFEGEFETWVTNSKERAAARREERQEVLERVSAQAPQKIEEVPEWGSW